MRKEILENIGGQLMRVRSEKGLEISKVAADLNMKQQLIHAIEEGNSEVLNRHAYTIGYIRRYSSYLGMSSEELLQGKQSSNLKNLELPSIASKGLITGAEFMPSNVLMLSCCVVLLMIYLLGG